MDQRRTGQGLSILSERAALHIAACPATKKQPAIAALATWLFLGLLTIASPAMAVEWDTYLNEDFEADSTIFYTGQAGEAFYSLDPDGIYIIDGMDTGSDSLSALTDNLYYYYLAADCKVIQSSGGELSFSGLVFHYHKLADGKLSYYVFYTYGDGYYGAKRVEGDSVDIILPLAKSELIDAGETNTLGVDAQGARFDLYINGKYVDGFTDAGSEGGGFGFYTSKHSSASFDNFIVRVEKRGGGREEPAAPSIGEGGPGGTDDESSARGYFQGYKPPVIPKDPNRPLYPWEVGYDKTKKKNKKKPEDAPDTSGGVPEDRDTPERNGKDGGLPTSDEAQPPAGGEGSPKQARPSEDEQEPVPSEHGKPKDARPRHADKPPADTPRVEPPLNEDKPRLDSNAAGSDAAEPTYVKPEKPTDLPKQDEEKAVEPASTEEQQVDAGDKDKASKLTSGSEHAPAVPQEAQPLVPVDPQADAGAEAPPVVKAADAKLAAEGEKSGEASGATGEPALEADAGELGATEDKRGPADAQADSAGDAAATKIDNHPSQKTPFMQAMKEKPKQPAADRSAPEKPAEPVGNDQPEQPERTADAPKPAEAIGAAEINPELAPDVEKSEEQKKKALHEVLSKPDEQSPPSDPAVSDSTAQEPKSEIEPILSKPGLDAKGAEGPASGQEDESPGEQDAAEALADTRAGMEQAPGEGPSNPPTKEDATAKPAGAQPPEARPPAKAQVVEPAQVEERSDATPVEVKMNDRKDKAPPAKERAKRRMNIDGDDWETAATPVAKQAGAKGPSKPEEAKKDSTQQQKRLKAGKGSSKPTEGAKESRPPANEATQQGSDPRVNEPTGESEAPNETGQEVKGDLPLLPPQEGDPAPGEDTGLDEKEQPVSLPYYGGGEDTPLSELMPDESKLAPPPSPLQQMLGEDGTAMEELGAAAKGDDALHSNVDTASEALGEARPAMDTAPGVLRVDDTFDKPRWPVSQSATASYAYNQGAYEVNNLNAQTMAISYQEDSFGDCETSVDAVSLGGDQYAGFGIAAHFKVIEGAISYYGLFVSEAGEFLLLKVESGQEYVLQDWKAAPEHAAGQPWRLALEIAGGKVRARINGELCATVTDASLPSGGYALLAGPGAAASFDNFSLRGLRQ